jgi:hypothetical protein
MLLMVAAVTGSDAVTVADEKRCVGERSVVSEQEQRLWSCFGDDAQR